MIAEANDYLAAKRIVRREPLYSANRLARFVQDVPIKDITPTLLSEFRERALAAGLTARTIESTIADVLTVMRWKTGAVIERGERIRAARPSPRPVDLSSIDAVWAHLPLWLQDWLHVAYWTGLRLSDSILCHATLATDGTVPDPLIWTANKTARQHCWPVPQWLRDRLVQSSPPYRRPTHYFRRRIRQLIAAACDRARVVTWTPKQLRQRSVTEWTRANATAGSIVHGCGLGVLSHYLDPLSVLESAAPRVRLPTCFGASTDSSEQLQSTWERLDPEGRKLILATAERLATG